MFSLDRLVKESNFFKINTFISELSLMSNPAGF